MSPWPNGLIRRLRYFAYDHAIVVGSSPAVGAHRQATFVVVSGFGHEPLTRCTLNCSVWADSARYMSTGVANELGAAKVKRRRRGNERQRDNDGLHKSSGRKSRPLPSIFRGDGITFTFLFLLKSQVSSKP